MLSGREKNRAKKNNILSIVLFCGKMKTRGDCRDNGPFLV
jgi:hypothetical protein